MGDPQVTGTPQGWVWASWPGDNSTAGAGTWLLQPGWWGRAKLCPKDAGQCSKLAPQLHFSGGKTVRMQAGKTSVIALVRAPAESPAAFSSSARFLCRRPGDTRLGSGFWRLSVCALVLYFGLCKGSGREPAARQALLRKRLENSRGSTWSVGEVTGFSCKTAPPSFSSHSLAY